MASVEVPEFEERPLRGVAGSPILRLSALAVVFALVLLALAIRTAAQGGGHGVRSGFWAGAVVLIAAGASGLRGLVRLGPGEAAVVQRFGAYLGSLRTQGLWWVSPLTRRQVVSTKVRSHQTGVLKVNDTDGVPIEIAMLVTWQVRDTAKALFAVDDYPAFLTGQCEMALRQVAAAHRYQPAGEGAVSLSTSTLPVAAELLAEAARRLGPAGITVLECQLVRIAYASEVAHAMLRRQQAAAVVAARQLIVDGAVGMVELALDRLEREHVIELDEERKATMVSNLLVVLCSDHAAQPMINTGSLYL